MGAWGTPGVRPPSAPNPYIALGRALNQWYQQQQLGLWQVPQAVPKIKLIKLVTLVVVGTIKAGWRPGVGALVVGAHPCCWYLGLGGRLGFGLVP